MPLTTEKLEPVVLRPPTPGRRLTEGWMHHLGSFPSVHGVWRDERISDHAGVAWQPVQVPHCFNAFDAVDPDQPYYQGQGWYRTCLDIDNPYPGGRTLLHFEGAGQKTSVYIHTSLVAHHVGGYDEFTVDITDAVEAFHRQSGGAGPVPLAVCCDNSRDEEMIPANISDFIVYGGLYRHVNLLYVPEVSLSRVHVDVQFEGAAAAITLRGRLHNPRHQTHDIDIHLQVQDPLGRVIQESTVQAPCWSDDRVIARLNVEAPALWSPDQPALYRVMAMLRDRGNESRVIERFGIRSFAFVKHGPFMLNGQRLLLRGTHRHEDHAGVGAAMTEAMIRREMQLMKDMGCNFVRLGHYQQSRLVLDLCDELGLLVYEEIPWCRGGLGGGRGGYQRQSGQMLAAMIDQHYNHPSIIIWGLGNEISWNGTDQPTPPEELRGLLQELHGLAHRLDPSRLTGLRACAVGQDLVDVYSPSIWAGWYRGLYTEYEAAARENFQRIDRFLHLEWGADSVAGRHAENPFTGEGAIQPGQGTEERVGDFMLVGGNPRVARNGDWSESYACDLIDWHLHAQESMDWLTGSAQWVFKDFATPLRPDNPLPFINSKGVLQRDMTPKEAYYVFQSYWTRQPMLRIHGRHARHRWGDKGERKLIKVYSNCPTVELFVNGISAGVRRRDPRDFPASGLCWLAELREGDNQLRAVGLSDEGRVVEDELVLTYRTHGWGPVTALRLALESTDAGPVRVHVTAHDARGQHCLDAINWVRFGLAGDGKLQDNLGTVSGSRRMQMSNGYASITFDPGDGQCVVSVSSPGLPTAFATWPGPPDAARADDGANHECRL